MRRRWRCVDRVCSTSAGLRLFCAAYMCLFAVAGVVLFRHRSASFTHTSLSSENSAWPTLDSFLSKSDRRWSTLNDGRKMDCGSLQDMLDVQPVAYGWTKAVYRAVLRGQPVAIKTVNMHGKDMMTCLGKGVRAAHVQSPSPSHCYRQAASKIIKEIAILTQLAPHDHFVQVLGTCVPDASGPVIVMTELGEPLDTVKLLRLSWLERLKLAKEIAEILHRLAHSPLGSLAMNDLRRQQFVLVDGTLKLSDVDDVGISEPPCVLDDQCAVRSDNNTVIERVRCVNSSCKGYNERLNIWRAGQHFIKQFLPVGAPTYLQPEIQVLLNAYNRRSGFTSWDTQSILASTGNLLHLYEAQENVHANRNRYGARKIPEEV